MAYWIEGIEVKSRYIGLHPSGETKLPHPSQGEMYVYVLCEPDGRYDVRYVGITTDPAVRLRQHLVPSRLKKRENAALSAWLISLLKRSVKPLMLTVEKVPGTARQEAEQKWITFFREKGADLTNISPGGGAVSEETHVKFLARWTPEARQEKAEILKRLWADPNWRAQMMTQRKAGKKSGRRSSQK
ncbi:MAG TPA: GIY-YIG nuclease family protein [Ktedonobacteraceae bacterium]|nr:GIY-YIG nuclease family protein [Ktedonobacteraceae bacterium]